MNCERVSVLLTSTKCKYDRFVKMSYKDIFTIELTEGCFTPPILLSQHKKMFYKLP